ncbi:dynamin family protein [Hydrocarboniclastica marina]|uniref:GTPase n=1 Tax=Hydrocarboniclastica marina TaxID=2259620 RepID=A0A4P7XFA6_9ALTE|nr:dynamin family protein [Hydrocarboniclastica marina]QCF24792.1 GTPase [Hydrocarboniclastica marina]|tara:strand:+ start:1674 stop:3638 length:1965 start_codon:yes stop_codon:yes gene_type:complete
MNQNNSLSAQVEAYHGWKKELIRQVARYRNWLQDNGLFTEDVSRRIHRGMEMLLDDELTIAFVGEYSRGKTELINALFFASFGQRMLPSQAGRTTMCPTELFYDRDENRDYLLLLPIETRREEDSLGQLRKNTTRWRRYELNSASPDSMQQVLAEVARVKSMSRADAEALGFDGKMLDQDRDHPGNVLVPAWRHAQISIKHPLLEQGLRILDTPGLNALGSEPELTISMLPRAHALIFLLSADAGVTASDMTIWRDYIDTKNVDHRAGRFAVLNKIDMLWDDLQGDQHTQDSLQRMVRGTAEQLGIPENDVVPVSAKQGLIARIRGDSALRERSLLPRLEALIIDRILLKKEQLLTHNLINDLLGMLQNSQAALQSRLKNLEEELALCQETTLDRPALKRLADRVQKDYDFYYKKLITLRSSRRLMQSQGEILINLVSEQRFEELVSKTRAYLKGSWTTLGMTRAADFFFRSLEADLNHLMSEGRLGEKMVASIYQRYNQDSRARHLEPIPLRAGRHVIAVRDLRKKAERFLRNPKNLLIGQSLLIQRFFATIVTEARLQNELARRDAQRWPEEALLPIMQFSLEQKKLLEHQIHRLRDIGRSEKNTREQRQGIQESLANLRKQLELADAIQQKVRMPAPTLAQQKVVRLSGTG